MHLFSKIILISFSFFVLGGLFSGIKNLIHPVDGEFVFKTFEDCNSNPQNSNIFQNSNKTVYHFQIMLPNIEPKTQKDRFFIIPENSRKLCIIREYE